MSGIKLLIISNFINLNLPFLLVNLSYSFPIFLSFIFIICVHSFSVSTGACRGPQKSGDGVGPFGAGVPAVVSHLTWALGSELHSPY